MDQEGLAVSEINSKEKTKETHEKRSSRRSARHLLSLWRRQRIEDHHIFFGTGGRTKSEEYGMKVHLCADCHREGPEAVHRYREADLYLKRTAQRQFEKNHTRQQFREIFGKSYLE